MYREGERESVCVYVKRERDSERENREGESVCVFVCVCEGGYGGLAILKHRKM